MSGCVLIVFMCCAYHQKLLNILLVCAGGNITDEGRSILLQCVGNKQFETREAWPECR